jgi:hypothetical protein
VQKQQEAFPASCMGCCVPQCSLCSCLEGQWGIPSHSVTTPLYQPLTLKPEPFHTWYMPSGSTGWPRSLSTCQGINYWPKANSSSRTI